ncbi:MAG: hypothetical protein G01um101413_83 [Parcubacteria group bacterium Gr01-1014_13]|nr:MAG: hypothetical protein G01um101413_83 [Parcubacteria group bacterium Gr01-1014_13]
MNIDYKTERGGAMRTYLFTKRAPTPGPYSQAICVEDAGKMIFLSGQTGNIPGIKGEPVIAGGLGPQTTQALKNILAIVETVGGKIQHIVELKIFLKDSEASKEERPLARAAARKTLNEAYEEFFFQYGHSRERKNLPARTMVWVSEVPLEFPAEDTLVEITAIAVIPKR